MLAFTMVFFSGVASSLAGLTYRFWHRGGYRPDLLLVPFAVLFTALGLLCTVAFGEPLYSPAALGLGLPGGISNVVAIRLMFAVTRRVKLSISWTMLQYSVLIPLAVGILAYGERLRPLTVAGTAMILLSVALFGVGRGKGVPATVPDLGSWVFLAACTLLNGGFFTISRVYVGLSPRGGTFTLMLYTGLGLMLAAGANLLWTTARGAPARFPPGMWRLGLYMASVNVAATALLVIALQLSPGTLVFPVRTVVNLLSVFLLSYLLFREKMNLLEGLGAAAALAGLSFVSPSLA